MRTILVPLDGSAFAEHALRFALGAARRTGARLRLVSVYEGAPPIRGGQGALTFDTRLDAELRAGLHAYLDDCRRRLGHAAPAVAVDTAVLDGAAAEAIAEHARASDAALVVLTTHGRRGLSRVWLGSVADRVVRHATTPVFLVRASDAAATRPSPRPRGVLVPLDGTTQGEEILEPLLELLEVFSPEVTLLRVVRPVRTPQYVSTLGMPVLYPDQESTVLAIREARSYLDRIASRLRQALPALRVTTRVEVDESASAAIVAASAECDLVAMATHGRGATRLVLGSVADKVMRGTDADLLLRRRLEDAPSAEREAERAAVGAG